MPQLNSSQTLFSLNEKIHICADHNMIIVYSQLAKDWIWGV